QLRGDEPMQVVSGRLDKPRVHFEAPPRNLLEQELNFFIEWFNLPGNKAVDPLIRAAITHLLDVNYPVRSATTKVAG
ncbi:MAG: hypothetical protein RL497_1819, partial [Pseudomonadota bacterium]